MLAKILAKQVSKGFNPEIAFLCGLLCRLGDLVILQYVSEFVDDVGELEKIQKISESQSSIISEQVVNNWSLPEPVTTSLKYGGNWDYNSGEEKANYADLMVVTNLYLRMLHNQLDDIPKFNKIPALKKVLNNNLTAKESIISEYKKSLEEFKSM
jgi:HD-like signal output (HDOD) protein